MKKLVENVAKVVSETFPNNVQTKVIIHRQRLKLPDTIMVFQAFAYLSATKLKPTTNQVLMLLFSKSMYENFISMDILTIAEEVNVSKKGVIRALKELVEHNIVIKAKHPSDKRRNDYFINPLGAWKGNSFARKKAIGKLNDPNQLLIFGQTQTQIEKIGNNVNKVLENNVNSNPNN